MQTLASLAGPRGADALRAWDAGGGQAAVHAMLSCLRGCLHHKGVEVLLAAAHAIAQLDAVLQVPLASASGATESSEPGVAPYSNSSSGSSAGGVQASVWTSLRKELLGALLADLPRASLADAVACVAAAAAAHLSPHAAWTAAAVDMICCHADGGLESLTDAELMVLTRALGGLLAHPAADPAADLLQQQRRRSGSGRNSGGSGRSSDDSRYDGEAADPMLSPGGRLERAWHPRLAHLCLPQLAYVVDALAAMHHAPGHGWRSEFADAAADRLRRGRAEPWQQQEEAVGGARGSSSSASGATAAAAKSVVIDALPALVRGLVGCQLALAVAWRGARLHQPGSAGHSPVWGGVGGFDSGGGWGEEEEELWDEEVWDEELWAVAGGALAHADAPQLARVAAAAAARVAVGSTHAGVLRLRERRRHQHPPLSFVRALACAADERAASLCASDLVCVVAALGRLRAPGALAAGMGEAGAGGSSSAAGRHVAQSGPPQRLARLAARLVALLPSLSPSQLGNVCFALPRLRLPRSPRLASALSDAAALCLPGMSAVGLPALVCALADNQQPGAAGGSASAAYASPIGSSSSSGGDCGASAELVSGLIGAVARLAPGMRRAELATAIASLARLGVGPDHPGWAGVDAGAWAAAVLPRLLPDDAHGGDTTHRATGGAETPPSERGGGGSGDGAGGAWGHSPRAGGGAPAGSPGVDLNTHEHAQGEGVHARPAERLSAAVISRTAWALGRLRLRAPPDWWAQFLGSDEAIGALEWMSTREAAQLVWALAVLRMPSLPRGFLPALHARGGAAGRSLLAADGHSIALLAWGLATLSRHAWLGEERVTPEFFLYRLASAGASHFPSPSTNGHSLSLLAWSLARMGATPGKEWCDSLARALLARGGSGAPLASQDLANAAWALPRLGFQPAPGWADAHARALAAAVRAELAAAPVAARVSQAGGRLKAAVTLEAARATAAARASAHVTAALLAMSRAHAWPSGGPLSDLISLQASALLPHASPASLAGAAAVLAAAAENHHAAAAAAVAAAAAPGARVAEAGGLPTSPPGGGATPPAPRVLAPWANPTASWETGALAAWAAPRAVATPPTPARAAAAAAAGAPPLASLPHGREYAGVLLLATSRAIGALSPRGLVQLAAELAGARVNPGPKWLARFEAACLARERALTDDPAAASLLLWAVVRGRRRAGWGGGVDGEDAALERLARVLAGGLAGRAEQQLRVSAAEDRASDAEQLRASAAEGGRASAAPGGRHASTDVHHSADALPPLHARAGAAQHQHQQHQYQQHYQQQHQQEHQQYQQHQQHQEDHQQGQQHPQPQPLGSLGSGRDVSLSLWALASLGLRPGRAWWPPVLQATEVGGEGVALMAMF
ncbi:hypothetical protein FOA52_011515 [Chlamydomonas sp. UWO 241]|nr:hypothetical protein FOA52_011515 [Chlamydomonas sp. UWO 241]